VSVVNVQLEEVWVREVYIYIYQLEQVVSTILATAGGERGKRLISNHLHVRTLIGGRHILSLSGSFVIGRRSEYDTIVQKLSI